MISLTFAVFVLAVCLFLLWRGKQLTNLKELGIPGPEPNLIFGNLIELIRKGPLQCYKEWIKKYGRVVGFHIFGIPIVIVADVDILRKIQISDFQKFINRPFTVNPPPKQKAGDFMLQMVNLRDKRWKDIRSILTPSFTTSKMRTMAPIINGAIDSLLDNIDEKARKAVSFDIYKFYQGLTMDVIGRTAFGIQTDCQKNPKDPLLRTARVMVSSGLSSFLFLIAITYPAFAHILGVVSKIPLYFQNEGKDPKQELYDTIRKVVKARRENPSNRRPDLLQLMIDARMDESDITNVRGSDLTAGGEEAPETNQSPEKAEDKYANSGRIVRSMDDEEILDNAALFFLAGYETTSTALAFTTHLLIYHPDVQEKLREEVKDLMKREGKLDYGSVHQLQYMDQVFTESLRLFPPVHLFVNRQAAEDVDFGSFRIKKGMAVHIPAHFLQHDPEYWENPEMFDPERFSPENKSKHNMMAFQSFGAGPRNCVGMRFAQMEAKLALARILLKYKLVKCEETDNMPPQIRPSPVVYAPKNGIYLKAIPL